MLLQRLYNDYTTFQGRTPSYVWTLKWRCFAKNKKVLFLNWNGNLKWELIDISHRCKVNLRIIAEVINEPVLYDVKVSVHQWTLYFQLGISWRNWEKFTRSTVKIERNLSILRTFKHFSCNKSMGKRKIALKIPLMTTVNPRSRIVPELKVQLYSCLLALFCIL